MIKSYDKLPETIEAVKWTENNLKEIMEFIGSEFKYEPNTVYCTDKFVYDCLSKKLEISTNVGNVKVFKGDYIIKNIFEEYSVCRSNIFKKCYKEK